MPFKRGDGAEMEVRADVDIRPGHNPDRRNSNQRDSNYPGNGGSPSPLRYGGAPPANTSIRNVRVGDVAGFGDTDLGPMELAGKIRSIPKVPAMQQVITRPITGAGPIEMQRLEQQQRNAIAMGDPDYGPMRELDYESVKDANFKPTRNGPGAAQ